MCVCVCVFALSPSSCFVVLASGTCEATASTGGSTDAAAEVAVIVIGTVIVIFCVVNFSDKIAFHVSVIVRIAVNTQSNRDLNNK